MPHRLLLLILAINVLAYGEDIYVAQAAAGTDNGSSCANAKSVAWFNTSANWGGGVGEIDPGDTVHLCGTITGNLTIQASGTEGNPITLIYESNAKSSAAAWGTGSSSAVHCSGKNFITIDGNNVGVIENTDNGTALGTQQQSYGIDIGNCDNLTIKNLTIQNIYVRTANSSDSLTHGRGINVLDGDNLSLTGNTISGAMYGILVAPNSNQSQSNINISGNTVTAASTGIVVALGGSGASISGAVIADNTIDLTDTWDGCWQVSSACDTWHHNDGIHVWGVTSEDAAVAGLVIRGNTIAGDFGARTTGWIFIEYYVPSMLIYNNVLVATADGPTNGMIALKGRSTVSATSPSVYNNTIVCNGSGNAVYVDAITGSTVKNNTVSGCGSGVYLASASATGTTSDYNDWHGLTVSPRPFRDVTGTKTFAEWQALGYDAHSITGDPLLTGSYGIGAGSPAIAAGTDLSGLGITALNSDKAGVARGASWDIGAYQYQAPAASRLPLRGRAKVTGSARVQ